MRVKDLTKQYDGKTVVDSVSFEIPKGKVISMIGPNGAGKSTVLNIISRLIARDSGLVDFDGRDIGTVVLPGADVKIVLTASPEDRARRRFDELRKRGQEADYDTVLRDIILRDEHDTRRSAAPLRQAKDALLVDTTGNSLDESLDVLLETIKERLKA